MNKNINVNLNVYPPSLTKVAFGHFFYAIIFKMFVKLNRIYAIIDEIIPFNSLYSISFDNL